MSQSPPLRLPPIAELERAGDVDRARTARLEALAVATMRRRHTRARIVLGGALIAELRDAPDDMLARRLVAIVADRVWRARDRRDILSQLGFLDPALLDDLGGGEEDSATGSAPVDRQPLPAPPSVGELPDFDAMVASALAERVPSESPGRDPDAQP